MLTKRVILLALCGFSTYGVYKAYNLPSVSRKRNRLVNLFAALISIVKTISDSSQILRIVSRDLKKLLASDQGQIPNSLKQLSKLAASDEFSNSLTAVSAAATLGVIQGYNEEQKAENSSFKDRVFDKLMSESGTGFVSVVVGSFARNLVNYEPGLKVLTDFPELVAVLSTDKAKVVMGDLVKKFVSSAVGVYLDRSSKSMNLYDGLFSGMSDPKHKKYVMDIVVHVWSGAVETLIKTSHHVLTS